jgi:hypothetical protein
MFADKPEYTQVGEAHRTSNDSFLKVLAYYRKLARWPITSFEATGQNDPNVAMGITKLWGNFS